MTRSLSPARPARRLALAGALALATLGPMAVPSAQAQGSYPSKPVTLVVPYPAGGSNDVFARLVAKGLGEALKQPVVVDNRPGASGTTGTTQVTKANPDGYTLVVVSSSMTTNAAVQPRMPYDPVKQLAPVALLARGPLVVTVNPDFPAKTPAELVQALKAKPGQYNYASSGNGSINQFATEMLKVATGAFVVHVPYRGMGPAVTDLAGGQTQLLIASGPSLLPHVRSGRLRAIGITSLQPSPIAPELTPMASAVPGFEAELWWGVLAPAGTPTEIVARLNTEINKLLTGPELRAAFLREGAVPAPQTPEQFGSLVASDIARWKKIAKQQSIVAE